MKNIFVLLILALTLTACSSNDSKKIDIENEMITRPGLTLSLEDGTKIPGFEGNYCTDVLCMESPNPDFSTLTYTAVPRDSQFLVFIDTTYEIQSISGSLYKKDGSSFNRNMEFTEVELNTYTPTEALDIEESEVAFHISVNFTDEGRTNYYFPVQLQ